MDKDKRNVLLARRLAELKEAYSEYYASDVPSYAAAAAYNLASTALFKAIDRILDAKLSVKITQADGEEFVVGGPGVSWIMCENWSRARWLDENGVFGGYEMGEAGKVEVI